MDKPVAILQDLDGTKMRLGHIPEPGVRLEPERHIILTTQTYPAGHCHGCGTGPGYSGPKTIVRIWTLVGQGEVFAKEVFSRPERFCRIYEPFSRKGLAINQFNTN
jgi:hypothetical protein